jgi:hypothetical protein
MPGPTPNPPVISNTTDDIPPDQNRQRWLCKKCDVLWTSTGFERQFCWNCGDEQVMAFGWGGD